MTERKDKTTARKRRFYQFRRSWCVLDFRKVPTIKREAFILDFRNEVLPWADVHTRA